MVRENTQSQGETRTQKRPRLQIVRIPAETRAHDVVLRVSDAAMAQGVNPRMAATPAYARWLRSWQALPIEQRRRIAHFVVTADLQVAEHALGV